MIHLSPCLRRMTLNKLAASIYLGPVVAATVFSSFTVRVGGVVG